MVAENVSVVTQPWPTWMLGVLVTLWRKYAFFHGWTPVHKVRSKLTHHPVASRDRLGKPAVYICLLLSQVATFSVLGLVNSFE